MIEQLARRVIVLLLFVMVLPGAVVVVGRIITETISMYAPGTVGPLGGLVLAFLLVLFTLGLVVRIGRARHGRDTARDARLERTAVRTPAPDVPLDREPIEPDDPDPALPVGGE